MVMFATTAHATAISFVVNVHLLRHKYGNASEVMFFSYIVFFVFQLRARQFPVAGSPSRSWQPDSPQLENEVLLIAWQHYPSCTSALPT